MMLSYSNMLSHLWKPEFFKYLAPPKAAEKPPIAQHFGDILSDQITHRNEQLYLP